MGGSVSAFVALRQSRKFWAAMLPSLYTMLVFTPAAFTLDWRYSFVAGGVPCLLFCAVILGIAIEDMAAKWPEPVPATGPQLSFNYSPWGDTATTSTVDAGTGPYGN